MDLLVGGASALGQADDSCAAFIGGGRPREIAKPFETPQQLVHRLLADAGALGEHARADAIGARELQHRHVRHAQLLETGRVQLGDDPAVNGLGRHAQQRADQHLVGVRRAARGA